MLKGRSMQAIRYLYTWYKKNVCHNKICTIIQEYKLEQVISMRINAKQLTTKTN